MRIFVTGGTGLLGNTLLRQLADAGHETIALVRAAPPLEVMKGITTEIVSGDLNDPAVIEKAVARCDVVLHSAGLIHLGWKRLEESMRVNRDGTKNIVNACLKHQRKLVHIGTVDTLAVGTREAAADETTPLDNAGGQTPCSYVESKRAGVAEVLTAVERGLQAVIIHPGFMLGPWDWKPSSGRMMLELGRGWKPIAPSGGCSVCDSRDVASGTIAAMERGAENGRQFILAGENWTYRDLWTEMAVRMGKRPPLMAAGPVQRWLGGVGGDAWAVLSGKEGDLNSAGVKMSSLYHWYDSSRARKELGYQTRDVRRSLDDAAVFLRTHHRI